MITREDERFIEYWKNNRENEKRTLRQLVIGLPVGLLFAVAIVAIFSSGWYQRAQMVAYSSFNPFVFLIALIAIIGFVAIFSKKHRWDMNEQRYQELINEQIKERNAAEKPAQ